MKALTITQSPKPRWLQNREVIKTSAKYAFYGSLMLAGPAFATGAADPGLDVVNAMTAVFTKVGTYVGTLMVAAATLFGLIQGGTAVFKIGRRLFGAAGA